MACLEMFPLYHGSCYSGFKGGRSIKTNKYFQRLPLLLNGSKAKVLLMASTSTWLIKNMLASYIQYSNQQLNFKYIIKEEYKRHFKE